MACGVIVLINGFANSLPDREISAKVTRSEPLNNTKPGANLPKNDITYVFPIKTKIVHTFKNE